MRKKTTKKSVLNEALEFQMLPRLKLMGFALIVLAAAAFSYSFFSTIIPSDAADNTPIEMYSATGVDLSDSPPFILTETEQLQLYSIATVFASLGFSSVIIARYKKKKLGC